MYTLQRLANQMSVTMYKANQCGVLYVVNIGVLCLKKVNSQIWVDWVRQLSKPSC